MRPATQSVPIPVNHLIISPQFLGTPVFSSFTQTRFLLLSLPLHPQFNSFRSRLFCTLPDFSMENFRHELITVER